MDQGEIIDAAYQAGRQAFDAGTSVRSIVEGVMVADEGGDAENQAMSMALGFVDALVDRLRADTPARIEAIAIEVGDTVVLSHKRPLSDLQRNALRSMLDRSDSIPPGVKVLVLDDGTTFDVLRKPQPVEG